MTPVELQSTVPEERHGARLDQVAAELFPDFSRARLQQWIKQGLLQVDGSPAKPKAKLRGGECLTLTAEEEAQGEWQAEDIPLTIVFEDEHMLVVDKPAGLVVHPAAGNRDGTLLNALLHHSPDLINIPRGGIVHRLDKDTTGLLVVAKTLTAHQSLVEQLQERSVGREYVAVVFGALVSGGVVDAPIGRHPRQRKLMAVVGQGGKEAITHYRVEERFQHYTLLRLKLATGRTHQIRVHMTHIGHPLLGDPTYAGRRKLPKGADGEFVQRLSNFRRQALHARRLQLVHPKLGETLTWESPLPVDMAELLTALRQYDQPD